MNKLICGQTYGTKAKDIYVECCKSFGWDISQSGRFGNQQSLYGYKAANDGKCDVWFICHSNCYGDVLIVDDSGVRHHRNYISTDGSGRVLTIKEYQQNAPFDYAAYPLRDRITFIKNKKRKYVYVGIYRAKEPNSKNPDRTFYRISDDYLR